MGYFHYGRNTFFPSILGRNPKILQILIYFSLGHLKKIIIGYSPLICWFATNLCGQIEETKIDLFWPTY